MVTIVAQALTPKQKVDLTPTLLSGQNRAIYEATDSNPVSFEINATFKLNSALILRMSGNGETDNDAVEAIIHLSDNKVNSDFLRPFYIIDIRYADSPAENYTIEGPFDINSFIALKFAGDTIHVGTPEFKKRVILKKQLPLNHIEAKAVGKVTVGRTIYNFPPESPTLFPGFNEQMIKEIASSANPDEGIWVLNNHELDSNICRLGGEYKIMTIADGNKLFLVYLNGATTYPGFWKAGMIKAEAIKSETGQDYHLSWTDAELEVIKKFCYMNIDGDNLTVQFPYLNATLTFSRVK
ncbi:MAG: hypothetical protein K2G64_06405 [Muribaculaceae bacterium]|nr:hypothetical protein [Muribaculaceae bacterium]MDE5968718.1 hypothetical protein [Muribaculaceae bacterium]MDE7394080.1 hypothetical protein [Muribaculaceae bacterium]